MNSANSTSNIATNTESKVRWNQMGNEEKSTSFHQEIKRMNQLPATSSYVSHRLRILIKFFNFCPFRIGSQDKELEFLFAGLHLRLICQCYEVAIGNPGPRHGLVLFSCGILVAVIYVSSLHIIF